LLTGEARAYDPDNVDPDTCTPNSAYFTSDNGTGIAEVEFRIERFNGLSWEIVHEQDQFSPLYCAFTGTPICETWDLGTLLWPPQDPDGGGPATPYPPQPIQSGAHRLKSRARDDEGNWSEWTHVDFTVDVDPTPTPSPTITPTPSLTPTPSPVPCSVYTLTGFDHLSDEVWWTLNNNGPTDVTIYWIEVEFDLAGVLTMIKLDGSGIWSGNLASPANVTGLSVPISAGSPQELRFGFDNSVGGSTFSVTVHFIGGCDANADGTAS
jgi:hypothetical protein